VLSTEGAYTRGPDAEVIAHYSHPQTTPTSSPSDTSMGMSPTTLNLLLKETLPENRWWESPSEWDSGEVANPQTETTAREYKERGCETNPQVQAFLSEQLTQFEGMAGVANIVEHRITMRDDRPIKQRYFPKNPAMQRIIDEQVDALLEQGCNEPSHSPNSAPLVLVRKKTGQWRMCVDYRELSGSTTS